MIRVLHSVSNMDRGGIETMLMNYYRHIDREKVQFDFIVNKQKPGDYDDEIRYSFPYFASSTRTGVSFSAGILTVGSRCSWLVSALAGLSAKWKGRKTVPGWRSVAVRRRATMEP